MPDEARRNEFYELLNVYVEACYEVSDAKTRLAQLTEHRDDLLTQLKEKMEGTGLTWPTFVQPNADASEAVNPPGGT